MNIPPGFSFARIFALLLIALALIGTATTFKFSIEAHLDQLDQKLQQDSATIAQFQTSMDAINASKTEAITAMSKQIESLQASFIPLGKTTLAQSDCLAQLHQDITTLQQVELDQADAQKKLSGHVADLEKNSVTLVAATDRPAPSIPPSYPIVSAKAPENTPDPAPAKATVSVPALPTKPSSPTSVSPAAKPVVTTPAPAIPVATTAHGGSFIAVKALHPTAQLTPPAPTGDVQNLDLLTPGLVGQHLAQMMGSTEQP